MEATDRFLSCDWGTSAFRLRLVAVEGLKIIAEDSNKQGTSAVNDAWKNTGSEETKRAEFYTAIIAESIKKLEEKTGASLDDVPVVISGMASSNIGMKEIVYKEIPFALDGADLMTELIKASGNFKHDTLLISGVKSADDVMRGEETQVVGCALGKGSDEQMVIHPGTHSKHIVVKDGQAVSFKTFMTGEIFSLLTTKSILAASVETEAHSADEEANKKAFAQGVNDGATQPLLHQIFLVRTAQLFKQRTKRENYHYLSGLLIGSELKSLTKNYSGNIILAGEAALVKGYKAALGILGIVGKDTNLVIKEADAITLRGQYEVFRHQQKA